MTDKCFNHLGNYTGLNGSRPLNNPFFYNPHAGDNKKPYIGPNKYNTTALFPKNNSSTGYL